MFYNTFGEIVSETTAPKLVGKKVILQMMDICSPLVQLLSDDHEKDVIV
jgi:hypothetical protein